MYTLGIWCEGGSTENVEFGERPSAREIEVTCKTWVADGDWGDEGALVRVWWSLEEGDGDEAEEIDSGWEDVEIEPDHAVLIRRAVASAGSEAQERSCGDDPDDHDWTSEGEGGCDENPGVWSAGGTTMVFRRHCARCGLRRRQIDHGPQRNPGEADTVEYEMPREWAGLDD